MKTRFLKSSFFFLLGLMVGLAISWTSFLEGIGKIILELTKTPYGPWVIPGIIIAVMIAFVVRSIFLSSRHFYELVLLRSTQERRDDIKECVKMALLELEHFSYNKEDVGIKEGEKE